MEAQEILNEILKSPKLKELLKLSPTIELSEDFNTVSNYVEIEIIKEIIRAQLRHTSASVIMQNITRLYMNSK